MRSILTQETSAKLCSFSACSLAATASVVPCQFAPPCRHPICRVMPPERRVERPSGIDASYRARGRSIKFGLLIPACGIFFCRVMPPVGRTRRHLGGVRPVSLHSASPSWSRARLLRGRGRRRTFVGELWLEPVWSWSLGERQDVRREVLGAAARRQRNRRERGTSNTKLFARSACAADGARSARTPAPSAVRTPIFRAVAMAEPVGTRRRECAQSS